VNYEASNYMASCINNIGWLCMVDKIWNV